MFVGYYMLLRAPAYVLEMYFVYKRYGRQMHTSPVDIELLFLVYKRLFLCMHERKIFLQPFVSYSRGNRSVQKIFDQLISSCLAVPLINSSKF